MSLSIDMMHTVGHVILIVVVRHWHDVILFIQWKSWCTYKLCAAGCLSCMHNLFI